MKVSDQEQYWQEFTKYSQRAHLQDRIIEQIYRFHINSGDSVIDGGANRGRHTLPLAAAVGALGSVLAVEPIPTLALKLEDVTAGQPVTVCDKALTNHEGQITFKFCEGQDTRSGIHARKYAADKGTKEITVECVMLDSLVPDSEPVTVIKLDLEGGEYHALIGGSNLLKRAKPLLILEHGGKEGEMLYSYRNLDYFNFLRSLGYELFDIYGREFDKASFSSPKVFDFIALDPSIESHSRLRWMLPTLLVAATQEATIQSGARLGA